MKPVAILPVLGFLVGTLFGALAFGDRMAPDPPLEQATSTGSATNTASAELFQVRDEPPSAGRRSIEGEVVKASGSAAAPSADPRIETALVAWRSAEARIADLQARIGKLERALSELDKATTSEPPKPPRTPDERRNSLVTAGVEPALADEILWRESRLELDRLNLRDLAVREGWVGTDRYREELNQLAVGERSVREEIGDTAWDRFLYDTGADNRVSVAALIQGSVAEGAGLQPGDLVEAYAGERVFGFAELRDATTQGESGELVAIRVRRGSGVVDLWVPRGPLGVRMEMTRAKPDP
jgi:uncharacterized membrane protein